MRISDWSSDVCSSDLAEFVLRALDRPEAADGRIFNAADSRQFTTREWVSAIAASLDWEFEFVDIPASIAPLGSSAVPMAGEYSWIRKSDVDQGLIRHQLLSNLDRKRTRLNSSH